MGVGVVYGCKLNGLAEIPTIYSYFSTSNFLLNQDFGSGQLGNTTNSFRNHMASLIMVKPRPDPSKVHINKMDVIPTSLSPPSVPPLLHPVIPSSLFSPPLTLALAPSRSLVASLPPA